MGLYQVPQITANTLVSVIKDSLVRFNLSISKARGQCYNGASNMSGKRNGVVTQIQKEEPRALFTHCYGHSLNLAASDTIMGCKLLKAALEMTHEIVKFIKYSPRRETLFQEVKGQLEEGSPGLRVLCPTRWTVHADSMASVLSNYTVLQAMWEDAADIIRDTDTKARIRGVAAQMETFDFFFGLVLGEVLLRHTDNLSRTLQNKKCSAAEGQAVAQMTVKAIQSLRNDSNYDLFWEKVMKMASEVDVEEPKLPRKRKVPRRYDTGTAEAEFHSSPLVYYRQIYYEAIDLICRA